jgi:small subunit ribosomal protein S4e
MGYKGQRKSMKRVNAPKAWYLGKLRGVYATKPSAGPHKTRECIPLCVLLQQRLKYALNRDEARKIVKSGSKAKGTGNIVVDGKVRRDPRFPLGCMDVVSIAKCNEHFRMLHDIRGRFQPHRIDAKEAGFKLCRVVTKQIGKSKVPHITTHDSRTIRFPHPDICINDVVKVNLSTGAIEQVLKFSNGSTVMLTGGNNIGRIGTLSSVERHPGTFDIAHVRDSRGNSFSTRIANVFIIGDGKTNAISLPKGEGIALSLIEERDAKRGDVEEEEEAE